MAPVEAAKDTRGYLFQLPALGLPDPAGEWVRVCVAIGRKEQCFSLLKKSEIAGGHLRSCTLVHKVMEVDVGGAVWFLPTVMPLESDSDLEIFQLDVHRLPLSSVPPAKRAELPDTTSYIFMVRLGPQQQLQLETGSFEPNKREPVNNEELLEKMNKNGGGFTIEGLQLWNRCSETTASQRDPSPPPSAPETPEETATREETKADALDTAWSIWHALAKSCLNQDFKKQLHRDAIAAGLIPSTTPFLSDRVFAHLRVSPEQDDDVRGLDYALGSGAEDEDAPEDEAKWQPLPPQAAETKWVRAGVNLERYELGKRLFTKGEWPPRPTTLMIRKLAGMGERSERR